MRGETLSLDQEFKEMSHKSESTVGKSIELSESRVSSNNPIEIKSAVNSNDFGDFSQEGSVANSTETTKEPIESSNNLTWKDLNTSDSCDSLPQEQFSISWSSEDLLSSSGSSSSESVDKDSSTNKNKSKKKKRSRKSSKKITNKNMPSYGPCIDSKPEGKRSIVGKKPSNQKIHDPAEEAST